MAENFPQLVTDTKAQIQEAQKTLSRKNTQNSTPSISYSNYE